MARTGQGESEIAHVMYSLTHQMLCHYQVEQLCSRPQLWVIYQQMQEWLMQPAESEASLAAVRAILARLDSLPDKALAAEIAETLRHYTPNAFSSEACRHAVGVSRPPQTVAT